MGWNKHEYVRHRDNIPALISNLIITELFIRTVGKWLNIFVTHV